MTGWDVLDKCIRVFPPIVAVILLVAAAAIFLVGFSRRGINFIKYGFGQTTLDGSLEKRFDELVEKMATKDDIGKLEAKLKDDIGKLDAKLDHEISGLRTELTLIKENHFGHLKNYLGILNGLFFDKKIIDNETKARLDNELRGM